MDRIDTIQKSFYSLFPNVKRLGLLAISAQHKTLQTDLRDGTQVTSEEFSEGMLPYLALAAISHLKRPSVIAIEEPESGLHPARIRDPTNGSKVAPPLKTPNFAERSKVYAPGELWLSYADGMDESALLNGGSAKAVSAP